MNYKIILQKNDKLGESPIWNNYNNKFYWVDIIGKKIKSLDENNIISIVDTNKMPCCISLIDNSTLTLALEDEIGIFDIRNNIFNSQLKIDGSKVRFNDGKIDNNNILHIGTMDRLEKDFIGKIYKYQNGHLDILNNNIGISNGIAFDSNNKMYYSDSLSGKLYYDNKLINTYKNEAPDGGYVDINDNYYSSIWGGSRIDIYSKEHKIIDTINLDIKYPTCCCFNGNKMNKLLICNFN